MAPAYIRPLPYLTPRHDSEPDATAPLPDTTAPHYKYPGWAFAVGVIAVLCICIFYSFACLVINRHSNKRAAFVAEFPCLDKKLGAGGVATGLATTSTGVVVAWMLPNYVSEIGPIRLEPEEEEEGLLSKCVPAGVKRLPGNLKRAVGRWRKKDGDLGVVELQAVEGISPVDDGKPEPAGLGLGMREEGDKERELETIHKEGEPHVAVPAPVAAPRRAEEDADRIAFVDDRGFENVDLK